MAHKIKVFFLLLGFLGLFNFWTISKLAALIFFNSEGNLIQGFRISRNFPLFPPCLHSSCYCSLLSYALLISKIIINIKQKQKGKGRLVWRAGPIITFIALVWGHEFKTQYILYAMHCEHILFITSLYTLLQPISSPQLVPFYFLVLFFMGAGSHRYYVHMITLS